MLLMKFFLGISMHTLSRMVFDNSVHGFYGIKCNVKVWLLLRYWIYIEHCTNFFQEPTKYQYYMGYEISLGLLWDDHYSRARDKIQ